ncbi:hypothetical protein DY000_02047438 [Brassica cretica]|uniref:Uncharacterized protein n=1 Tax=Brassica cretica TaxID=69181 RepID=A0ABQ7EVW8_BRACR|nr:hypothetical protein DY000_02047438 [Brassica cretica]
MLCYGPSPSVANDPSSLYVWELPHNLLSLAGKCLCGDCPIREAIMTESLPVWFDWQKKRVTVLGFGVLNKYLPTLGSSNEFTLIRLTSSGKLEAVKFNTSPDPLNSLGVLDYLSAYTKGNLAKFLESRISKKRSLASNKKSDPLSLTYHEELCEKLNLSGFGRDRCSTTVTAIFNSISSPTSVFDIALGETWPGLPIELLLLAFSYYTEVGCVLRWSKKIQSGVDLIGPVPPLLVLLALHEFRNGCLNSEQQEFFSPDAEFSDRDSHKEKKRFIAYSPITKTGDSEELTKFVSKVRRKDSGDDDVVGGR